MARTQAFGELLLRESESGAVFNDHARERLVRGEALLLSTILRAMLGPATRSVARVIPIGLSSGFVLIVHSSSGFPAYQN